MSRSRDRAPEFLENSQDKREVKRANVVKMLLCGDKHEAPTANTGRFVWFYQVSGKRRFSKTELSV
ncbi:MAG: hypothetical protein KME28_12045 [Pelatocladus maniniholoensis HA4357-MV3]|jgi:hypothetical protein|uniref:Uncharacterized protein n=1 Tax=Pelatocladus maniniholoensis HA4357-MV3 TaxID=1117104 RepID=A0A9E3LTY3_9NOST|nr:hypothetical protein [Pelatocladus maniniholoensis HA4357-MV3]BAZ66812.1 hypothetical protein NIES4106_15650 [Fischerella sp. NIES-4106]